MVRSDVQSRPISKRKPAGSEGQRKRAREAFDVALLRGPRTVTEVLHELELNLPWAPSRATIYVWMSEWKSSRASDKSGAWTLTRDQTRDPATVIEVLGEVLERTAYRVISITNDDAAFIVMLRRSAPDLPAWQAYELSQFYRGADDDKLARLDHILAEAAWRDNGARTQRIHDSFQAWVLEALEKA